MAGASTFIDTCEDDAFAAAARFVADATSSPEIADVEVFVRDAPQYVDRILKKKGALFALSADKDVEAFFVVLASTAAKLEGAAGEAVLRRIVDGVGGSASSENAALRLRILFALFNASAEPAFRYQVFLSALQLASAASLTEALLPSLKRTEEWVREWKLAKAQTRDIYSAVSALLRDSKGGAKESYAFLLKFLGTFEVRSASACAAVTYTCDVLRLSGFFTWATDRCELRRCLYRMRARRSSPPSLPTPPALPSSSSLPRISSRATSLRFPPSSALLLPATGNAPAVFFFRFLAPATSGSHGAHLLCLFCPSRNLASQKDHAPLHALLVIVLTGEEKQTANDHMEPSPCIFFAGSTATSSLTTPPPLPTPSGDLAAYKKWHDANKAFLTSAGLSHDDLVAKMRLMSLIALGAESATGEVAYDAVQAALQARALPGGGRSVLD